MNHTPVRIFVLWHPKYAAGLKIAQAIFDWFRTPDGHGIQVHYRSETDPRRSDGLPPPMPLDRAIVNLVVLLAESQMVRDRLWREWLTMLADEETVARECQRGGSKKKAGYVQIYPVALQGTAYKLPGSLRKLNFITPQGLHGRTDPDIPVKGEELLPILRTQLTEAFARILGQTLEMHSPGSVLKGFFHALLSAFSSTLQKNADEPPKVKVFISHAKRDGIDVARALRDYIYQQTQLSAFFDENDIALGFKFAEVLERSIRSETVAMISVNGDYYSARPWCRREIQLFSRPRKSKNGVWEKAPILVVQSMGGGHVANAIPEFGNAPVLRWRAGDAALCIDTLLREAIFRTYHSYVASAIKESLDGNAPEHNRIFVNWPPDPLGLDTVIKAWEREQMETWRQAANKATEAKKRRPPRPKLRPLDLIYPGRGLSSIELEILTESHTNVRLLSYNEARSFAWEDK